MTRAEVMRQLKNLLSFNLTWVWNDCVSHYALPEDKYIDDLWDEMYTTEEVRKMVDFEKLADYVMEVKYWEAMPEIIKEVKQ